MRSLGSLDRSPRFIITQAFHLLEAWYEPGTPPLTLPPHGPDCPTPPDYWDSFRLILDPLADEEALRRFPFMPPADGVLLFVARGADPPWSWHTRPGFYLEFRSLRRQRIYVRGEELVIRRVLDTEALWSAFVAHREFVQHSGELSDAKLDWLSERIIERARQDVERWPSPPSPAV